MKRMCRVGLLMIALIYAAKADDNKIPEACKVPEPEKAEWQYTIDASRVGVAIEDKVPSKGTIAVVVINKNPFRFRYSIGMDSRPLAVANVLDFLKSMGVPTSELTTLSAQSVDNNQLTETEKQLNKAKIAHKKFLDATQAPDTPCIELYKAATEFLRDAVVPNSTLLKKLMDEMKDQEKDKKDKLKAIETDSLQIENARSFVEELLNTKSAFHEIRYLNRQTQPSLVTLTLSRSDLRTEKPTTEDVATLKVAIGSVPLSVSIGVGFSTVDEIIISRQAAGDGQGGATTVFGYENDSRMKPSGVAMLTGHIMSFKSWTLGASAGFVLSSRSDRSEIEYILGPSFGFRDELIWLTAGMHVARVQKLAGGFSIGDKVPSALQDPLPLQRNYKPGLMFSLTFKIR